MIVVNPNNPRGIVWIASYPKSGNTWIRIFLYHLVRLIQGQPRTDNDLHALDRVSGYEARFFSLFTEKLGKPLEMATFDEIAAIRPDVQTAIRDRAPSVAIVKTHNLMGRIRGKPTVNLEVSAGAICVIRDPRDVVISLADHLGRDINTTIGIMGQNAFRSEHSADIAPEMWGSWSEHVRSWTMAPDDAILVVRYEDMLSDPQKQFAAIARHVRQAPNDAQLSEAIELSSFKELSDLEERISDFRERSERADRFFRVGKAGQWKDVLTTDQINRIETEHRDQMIRYGYLT